MTEEQSIYLKNGLDMITLISCLLHGTIPSGEQLSGMDLAAVRSLAGSHMIGAIVGKALERAAAEDPEAAPVPPEEMKKWQEIVGRALRKSMLMDQERAALQRFMEENGIWYLPLKGCVLQELYPVYGVREMSDQDLLYDPAFAEQVRDYMLGRGFSVEHFGRNNCDAYRKEPFYNFELHTELFNDAFPEWNAYYKDVKDRLLKDADNSCGRHFSDEDFYLYLIAHACKHFRSKGTGVRTLIDLWLFLAKHPAMDRAYIEGELEKLGVSEDEKLMRTLAEKLFAGPEAAGAEEAVAEETGAQNEAAALSRAEPPALTEAEQQQLLFILSAGTFGTIGTAVQRRLSRLTAKTAGRSRAALRLEYIKNRVFLSEERYKNYYPAAVYKHKILRPFYTVYRLGKGIVKHPKKLIKEMEELFRR